MAGWLFVVAGYVYVRTWTGTLSVGFGSGEQCVFVTIGGCVQVHP